MACIYPVLNRINNVQRECLPLARYPCAKDTTIRKIENIHNNAYNIAPAENIINPFLHNKISTRICILYAYKLFGALTYSRQTNVNHVFLLVTYICVRLVTQHHHHQRVLRTARLATTVGRIT